MRYHLWFVPFSQKGPHGVLDSCAVTGANRPVPYCASAVRAAAPRCIHKASSPPFHLPGGSLHRNCSATIPFPHIVPTLAQIRTFVNRFPLGKDLLRQRLENLTPHCNTDSPADQTSFLHENLILCPSIKNPIDFGDKSVQCRRKGRIPPGIPT